MAPFATTIPCFRNTQSMSRGERDDYRCGIMEYHSGRQASMVAAMDFGMRVNPAPVLGSASDFVGAWLVSVGDADPTGVDMHRVASTMRAVSRCSIRDCRRVGEAAMWPHACPLRDLP